MSNKFHSSDTVRVIKSCGHFDSVGQIFEVGYRGGKPRYHVYFDDLLARWFYDDDLTLADPDVHTVLDEMDAESAPTQADLGPHFAAIEKSQAEWDAMVTPDPVSAPSHYRSHPSGIETITITRHESFLRGNVLKYVLRAPYKDSEIEDLKKAAQYLQWEIDRAEAAQ